MDMSLSVLVIFSVFIGYLFGRFSERISRKTPDGIFHVNTTDPDKDVFTLELLCPLSVIPAKKRLIFKIQNEGSQEKPLA